MAPCLLHLTGALNDDEPLGAVHDYWCAGSSLQGPAPQGADGIEDGKDVRQGAHHPQQERRPGQSSLITPPPIREQYMKRGGIARAIVYPIVVCGALSANTPLPRTHT